MSADELSLVIVDVGTTTPASLVDVLDDVDVKPLVMLDVAVGVDEVVEVVDGVGAVAAGTGSGGGGTGLVVVGDEAVEVDDELVEVVLLDVDVELVDDEVEVVEDVEVDVAGAGGGATGVVAVVDEVLLLVVDPVPLVDF